MLLDAQRSLASRLLRVRLQRAALMLHECEISLQALVGLGLALLVVVGRGAHCSFLARLVVAGQSRQFLVGAARREQLRIEQVYRRQLRV